MATASGERRRPTSARLASDLRRDVAAQRGEEPALARDAPRPQIHALQVAADKAEADAKRLIEDLRAKKKAFKARLGEVKQAGDKAWEDVKTGSGKAWEELRPAVQSAIARFK